MPHNANHSTAVRTVGLDGTNMRNRISGRKFNELMRLISISTNVIESMEKVIAYL